MNLADANHVYAVKFLSNKRPEEARALLDKLGSEEVKSLYEFMVPQ